MSDKYRFINGQGSPLDLITCDKKPEDRDPFSFDVLPVLKGASAYDCNVIFTDESVPINSLNLDKFINEISN
jgi:hypothetical protein